LNSKTTLVQRGNMLLTPRLEKLPLTERDSFRVREFPSTGVWRFWWLWLPISLTPIWIFDYGNRLMPLNAVTWRPRSHRSTSESIM
jgi:hypothetical protein